MRKAFLLAALFALSLATSVAAEEIGASSAKFWSVPQVDALPYDAHSRLIRHGRDLITATYSHIGPDMPDPAQRLRGQQSRLRQLPSRRRREEIRSADFRTGRGFPRL